MTFPIIQSSFYLDTASVDPDACTVYLGLQPTKIVKKADPFIKAKGGISRNSWQIDTERQHLLSLNQSIEPLLEALWPVRQKVIEFCRQHDLSCIFVSVVWEGTEQTQPAYDLSQEAVSRIAAFEASWNMDIM